MSLEIDRRTFVGVGTTAGLAIPLMQTGLASPMQQHSTEALRRLVLEGVASRVSDRSISANEMALYKIRVLEEVRDIDRLDEATYFLRLNRLVDALRREGIPIGPGRGCASASLVNYCLRLTDVDPILWGLPFARATPFHSNPKFNFSIDTGMNDSEMLLGIATDLFGVDRVATLTSTSGFKQASSFTVGEDAFSGRIPFEMRNGHIHTSLTSSELSNLGYRTYEFLQNTYMSLLQRLEFLEQQQCPGFRRADIEYDDPAVTDVFRKGVTHGLPDFSSRGMRVLLRRSDIRSFSDVSAILSMYRPGPLSLGFADDFAESIPDWELLRSMPDVEQFIGDTRYRLIYQEQLIDIMHSCGLTYMEANHLRREFCIRLPQTELAVKLKAGIFQKTGDRNKARLTFERLQTLSHSLMCKAHVIGCVRVAWECAFFSARDRRRYHAERVRVFSRAGADSKRG